MHDYKPSAPNNTPVFWIAYSGGLDSHVLLHKLAMSPPGLLKAVHIHHGLSPNADRWEVHCHKTCALLDIEYRCIRVHAHPEAGQSPEAAAREARYKAFSNLLEKDDYLLTAHHQDDQAETLLLQLFRGAGIKGLAAMPQSIPFAQGYLLRPLLTLQRQELLNYAEQQQLSWIEDESNTDIQFDRNYVRHHLLPVIQKRWSNIASTLARVASHCAEADQLLHDLAEQDLQTTLDKTCHTLSIPALLKLSYIRQKNLLRHWLGTLGLPVPSAQQLQQLKINILHSRPDACPEVHWPGVNIRRYRDTLYAYPDTLKWVHPKQPIVWDILSPLTLPDGRVLSIKNNTSKNKTGTNKTELGLRADIGSVLQVRFRQNGERCHPVGRQGSHPLKKLFQEWGVPPWERDAVPLLYLNDTLVCVVGYCICQSFAATSKQKSWIIQISTI
jgi:tRNA(Ile)-lysidine synthase